MFPQHKIFAKKLPPDTRHIKTRLLISHFSLHPSKGEQRIPELNVPRHGSSSNCLHLNFNLKAAHRPFELEDPIFELEDQERDN